MPSVDRVLASLQGLPHGVLLACAQNAVDAARTRVEDGGGAPNEAEIIADARNRAVAVERRALQPVVNATGVLMHTNLGRAPLGRDALDAVVKVAVGYSNLEYDLEGGGRGSRHGHAATLIAQAVGAEAGLVVNNNAAAVLLSLAALARDREVIVSRGELVEIGGGFRVPEIMAESRCRLIEVGTTNRTRRSDYETALTGLTALVLKVHASNYRMVGFTGSAPVRELAGLGPPVMVDIGSGLLDESTPWLAERPAWLGDEPGVRQAIQAGAGLVTFSGDKLTGGPQAGIIVGRRDLVETVSRHPLARATRADKMTLAGLQAIAQAYLSGDGTAIPFWRLATIPVAMLRERAAAIAGRVPDAEVVENEAVAGAGSMPGLTIPSVGVAIEGDLRRRLAHLRACNIVARVTDERVVCDLRGVEPEDDDRLVTALLERP